MKKTIALILIACTTASFAEDLSQLYEKAYYLETAKGQPAQALEIYRRIAVTKATKKNREVLVKTLERMLALYKGHDRAQLSKNAQTALAHLDDCEKEEITPPVGFIGSAELRRYWENVPELKVLRQQFIRDDDAFGEVLKTDDGYRKAREAYDRTSGASQDRALKKLYAAKNTACHRLKDTNAYIEAMNQREESLRTCNIETIRYIIQDYEKRGKTISIDWID